MPEVSIIIRTKNEERWISHCIAMLYNQKFKDFEIILVDNASTDYTVEVAKRYPIDRVINIDKFLPGDALNAGIRISSGRFIVCLSAHCVPKTTDWLSTLLANFTDDPSLAGVYGRQLPVSYTDPIDKRDLLIIFGQDRRVQVKDYFFHNANSMLRRDVWEKFPFDDTVTNIEDRVWGKAVISAGYHIVYDPEAEVYHHHGLHQGNKPSRVSGVVSIIEKTDHDVINDLPASLKPENVNVVAVLPVMGMVEPDTKAHALLAKSIAELKRAKYVNKIFLATIDSKLAEFFGVLWVDRRAIPNADSLGMDQFLQKCLEVIELVGDYPAALLYVNYDYLNRPENIFDELIFDAQYKGCDTVFPGYLDYGHYWLKNADDDYQQTDSSLQKRSKRQPIYRALYGLGCLSSSAIVHTGKIIGGKIGILPIDDFKSTLRLRDFETISNWNQTDPLIKSLADPLRDKHQRKNEDN
jgi:rhamnosyltransferase